MSYPIFRLRSKEHGLRVQRGHPWAYQEDLRLPLPAIEPGTLVELQDGEGKSIGRGFGNPKSDLAFRRFDGVLDANTIRSKMIQAFRFRERLGVTSESFRLLHADADGMPGLIADCYLGMDSKIVALVLQINSVSGEKLVPWLIESWGQEWRSFFTSLGSQASVVILRRDSNARLAEGLQKEETTVQFLDSDRSQNGSIDFQNAFVALVAGLSVSANLFSGQKTGHFLDQTANLRWLQHIGMHLWGPRYERNHIRVLDWFSYTGQAGLCVAKTVLSLGKKIDLTLVDSSQDALDLAKKNLNRLIPSQGRATLSYHTMDIVESIGDPHIGDPLIGHKFDVVLVDPPAFAKSRRDKEAGLRAYAKVNAAAMQKVVEGGVLMTHSCSGVVQEHEFYDMLRLAARKANAKFMWVYRGGQSPDHPVLTEFPESKYLKTMVGIRIPLSSNA